MEAAFFEAKGTARAKAVSSKRCIEFFIIGATSSTQDRRKLFQFFETRGLTVCFVLQVCLYELW